MLQNHSYQRRSGRCTGGLAAIAALALVAITTPAQAQNQSDLATWPVKGRLVNGDGSAVEGTQTVDVAIHGVTSTGPTSSPLWSDTIANVTFRDGFFSLLLGDGSTSLVTANGHVFADGSLSTNDLYYTITLTIGGTTYPEIRLSQLG